MNVFSPHLFGSLKFFWGCFIAFCNRSCIYFANFYLNISYIYAIVNVIYELKLISWKYNGYLYPVDLLHSLLVLIFLFIISTFYFILTTNNDNFLSSYPNCRLIQFLYFGCPIGHVGSKLPNQGSNTLPPLTARKSYWTITGLARAFRAVLYRSGERSHPCLLHKLKYKVPRVPSLVSSINFIFSKKWLFILILLLFSILWVSAFYYFLPPAYVRFN